MIMFEGLCRTQSVVLVAYIYGLHSQSNFGVEQQTEEGARVCFMLMMTGKLAAQLAKRRLHLSMKAFLQAIHILMQDVTNK